MLSEERVKRIKELKNRSYDRGIFTFTDFMSPTSLAEAVTLLKKGEYTIFGGVEYAERKMIRFGSLEDFGYEEPFPITLLKVTLLGGKFATPITHRDVLGATLNLGIERQKLGDIFINAQFAYIIAEETVAVLIKEELKSIGKNKVSVEEIFALPSSLAPKTEEVEFSVASNRADAVVCKVFNLSRETGSALFEKGLVAVNGRIVDVSSKCLTMGDVVAVRGYGKFEFLKEDGFSKKGKLYVVVNKYVG